MFVTMFAKIKQQFLSIFFPITIFLSACAAQQQSVEILHINDSHSYLSGISQNGKPNYDNQSSKGGFARINNVIKNHQNSVVLDAGDRFQGSLYFSLFGSEPIIKIDNASSFSALTLGNHEFDKGCKFLNSYINQLKTPVLVANMRLNTQQNCPLTMDKIQAFLVKELHNGDKIGIIGISHDNPKISILSKDCDCIDFVDYKTAIITQINALKAQKINKIILLTHLGLDKDIGSIEVGKKADIILVDTNRPNFTPLGNSLCANIVYSVNGDNVDTTICDGNILMENRKLVSLDEQSIINNTKTAIFDLLSLKEENN